MRLNIVKREIWVYNSGMALPKEILGLMIGYENNKERDFLIKHEGHQVIEKPIGEAVVGGGANFDLKAPVKILVCIKTECIENGHNTIKVVDYSKEHPVDF